MKFNLNNPAFLQMAGNVGGTPETRFVFVDGQNQVLLSSSGDVIIESMQGGEVVRETYSSLNNTAVTINADEGTEVVIYGAVTILRNHQYMNVNTFTLLDVSKSTELTQLQCAGCTGLTSLDVSKNTKLVFLSCAGCTGLTSLDVSKNTELGGLHCNNCTGLVSLDVSKNTKLIELQCAGCTGLTSLDVSKNTELTRLSCGGCTSLTGIKGIAVNGDVSTAIATAITDATSVDGTVTLRQGDEHNQTIIDAAMEKGWDVQYYS